MVTRGYWIGTMKDWKARQTAYHTMGIILENNMRDDLNNVDIVITENVVDDALRHFNECVDQWIYPAKSYVVAICYANWLAEDFGEQFYEVLDDKELLFGNDPYFVPYLEDKEIYDTILSKLKFDSDKGMVPDIRKYYEEEMLYGL